MSEVIPAISLEIPSGVAQQEVWDLEERLNQIEGISTDLQESRSTLATVLAVLNIAASVMGPVGVIAGGAKAVHEVAKILHEFIHTKSELTLLKKGKRIELKKQTVEEIERLIKEE